MKKTAGSGAARAGPLAGGRVTLQDGRPRDYDDWQRNIAAPETGPLIFPTGVGGVFYAAGVFHEDVTDVARFQELAPLADDVWLYWMHRLRGSAPAKIGGRFRITEWPGTQVQNLRSGQPTMTLTGWAAERLAAMTPPGHHAQVHVTLTDDHPWAQAFVVIEARVVGA